MNFHAAFKKELFNSKREGEIEKGEKFTLINVQRKRNERKLTLTMMKNT